MRSRGLQLVVAGLIVSSVSTDAISASRARQSSGHMIALRMCAECHAVDRRRARSPNHDAPTFRVIANSRVTDADDLSVEIRRKHLTMPLFDLKDEELGDVIAYILSLRRVR